MPKRYVKDLPSNIYFQSRLRAGIKNRDIAAMIIDRSLDSVSDYETGRTPVPEDVVFAMAKGYGDPFLIIEHFQNSQTGKFFAEMFGFRVQRADLPEATLQFIAEIEDIDRTATHEFSKAILGAQSGQSEFSGRKQVEQFSDDVADVICRGANLLCLTRANRLTGKLQKEKPLLQKAV